MKRFLFVIALVSSLFAARGAAAEEYVDSAYEAKIVKTVESCIERHVDSRRGPEEKGHALTVAGMLLAAGQFGYVDPDKALGYYNRALAHGSPEAAMALVELYRTGLQGSGALIGPDPDKVFEYLEKAASLGSTRAMLELGDMYANGVDGIRQDVKKGYEYFIAAAKHGDESALRLIEPEMKRWSDWIAKHPEVKPEFPLSREEVVDPALAAQTKKRAADFSAALESIPQILVDCAASSL